MQSETTYSGILGKLQRFQVVMGAMIGVQILLWAQGLVQQTAALIASQQEPVYEPTGGIRTGIVVSAAETPRRGSPPNVFVTRLGASLRTVGGKAEDRGCTDIS